MSHDECLNLHQMMMTIIIIVVTNCIFSVSFTIYRIFSLLFYLYLHSKRMIIFIIFKAFSFENIFFSYSYLFQKWNPKLLQHEFVNIFFSGWRIYWNWIFFSFNSIIFTDHSLYFFFWITSYMFNADGQ